MKKSAILLMLPLILGSQTGHGQQSDLEQAAKVMAQKALIVDTHIDVPYRLHEAWVDVSQATDGGDFDYVRAMKGGLNIPFMSIYTPAEMEQSGGGFELANRLIDNVEAIVGRAPDKFAMATSTEMALKAQSAGLIGLAMGMENGSPIEGKLENLAYFHDRGIRYITLAHSKSNHISDSSFDKERQWHGLSPFGREVVAEMNRLGIMVDISHVSDEAFYQVVELSTAPVIASHSSTRHFTPGFERNMSDEMIRALAKNGGVIQINFGSAFVSTAANAWFTKMMAARTAWLKESGHDAESKEARAWQKSYLAELPLPFATLSELVDHFDHVVELVGVDHVGIGSDYDGVGDSLPVGIKDVSFYPALIEELLRREYTPQQIEAILGGNLMRVWRAVEAVSDHS